MMYQKKELICEKIPWNEFLEIIETGGLIPIDKNKMQSLFHESISCGYYESLDEKEIVTYIREYLLNNEERRYACCFIVGDITMQQVSDIVQASRLVENNGFFGCKYEDNGKIQVYYAMEKNIKENMGHE